jgi:hypothetical protein
MTRITVSLPNELSDALSRSAAADLRPPRLQALALIRDALESRGALRGGEAPPHQAKSKRGSPP